MTYFKLLMKNLRLKSALWIFALCGLSISIPPVFNGLYSTAAEQEGMKMTVDNPAMVALIGPVPGGEYTSAVMFGHQMLMFMALFHGLFGILIANGIARKAEESGLTEYVLSAGIGKKKIVTAQLMSGFIINALVFIILFGGLSIYDIEGLSVAGNLYYALGLALFGLLFFIMTLVLGNLFDSGDMTFGIALSLLIVFYLYRAVTDVANTAYSVISPYHWLSRIEVYGDNAGIWLLPFTAILILIIFSYVLFLKRDIGDSYIKIGKKKNLRKIYSYPKLAFINMRVMIISWLIGLFAAGLSYGSIFGDLESLIGENDMLRESLGSNDAAAFFIGMLIVISALIAAVPALMINGRMLNEEKNGRLEVIIAGMLNKKVSRTKVFITHYLYGIAAGISAFLFTILGMYLASMNVDDLSITIKDYVLSAVNYSAGIIFITGVSALFAGISKKLHLTAWLYAAYIFFANYFGVLINIDEVYLMLSPFYYLSDMPYESMDIKAVIIIAGLGIMLAVIGAAVFKRRNLL